jgi:hypothetical protein
MLCPFEVGKEYLVSSQRRDPLDPRDLERFKADGLVLGSSRQCVMTPIDIAVDKILREAPGEPPLERQR